MRRGLRPQGICPAQATIPCNGSLLTEISHDPHQMLMTCEPQRGTLKRSYNDMHSRVSR
jgi:hypothetical protein